MSLVFLPVTSAPPGGSHGMPRPDEIYNSCSVFRHHSEISSKSYVPGIPPQGRPPDQIPEPREKVLFKAEEQFFYFLWVPSRHLRSRFTWRWAQTPVKEAHFSCSYNVILASSVALGIAKGLSDTVSWFITLAKTDMSPLLLNEVKLGQNFNLYF